MKKSKLSLKIEVVRFNIVRSQLCDLRLTWMVHQTGLRFSSLNRPKLLQALYENMMIEIPFASFFLSKMLGQVPITLNFLTLSLLWQNKLVECFSPVQAKLEKTYGRARHFIDKHLAGRTLSIDS
jgi:hypothetical protein